ncbi:MAG: sigma-70 family RNA polymerase sigma factor [Pseudomonadota bacterium]|nr:sigma-70 family RNA polymerase sigma factor [Pseudomonadota bacterium]
MMVQINVNGKTVEKGKKTEVSSSDPVVSYLNAISGFCSLSKEEEFALFHRYKEGDDQAYNQIVEANLRIVVKVARRYSGRGIALLDLIEEGNLGLLHAIKKFEVERGFRFSTYSIWWIKQYIERAIMNQSRQIRLPVHVIKKLTSYLNAGSKMGKSNVEDVSCEEIAGHFDIEVDQVQKILKYKLDTKSLDESSYFDSEVSLTSVVEDRRSKDPLDIVGNDSTRELLKGWLDKLSEIDYDVIVHRYGLCGHDAKTLEEVGEVVGLTRERVRQIQIRALSRMRRCMNFSGVNNKEADMNDDDEII